MHKMICAMLVCSREIIHVFCWSSVLACQKRDLLGDAINVINVRLCMVIHVVLLTELSLFIPLSVTLTIFQGHSNIEEF